MYCSKKIDVSLAGKLKKDLTEQGFNFSKPLYTIFSAKKKGIVCTLYESGTLMVQGKNKDEFIEFYLEPEIFKTFEYTHPKAHIDMTPRIGVDEAGKGDFFGPLCIAGFYANLEDLKKLVSLKIQDSKKISDLNILKLYEKLKDFNHFVIAITPKKYNELYPKFKNLNSLLAWGHASVIEALYNKTKCKEVIIDQFAAKYVVETAVKKKNISINLKQVHRAEEDIVVAAASIIARASFLKGLEKLSKEIGMTLPKGATHVIDSGRKILKNLGEDVLDKVCKKHFKTYTIVGASKR